MQICCQYVQRLPTMLFILYFGIFSVHVRYGHIPTIWRPSGINHTGTINEALNERAKMIVYPQSTELTCKKTSQLKVFF